MPILITAMLKLNNLIAIKLQVRDFSCLLFFLPEATTKKITTAFLF